MHVLTPVPRILMGALFIAFLLLMSTSAYALTVGETYTITVEKVNSNGTVTSGLSSLGLSTTATADSNGKISFSLSGVPNNDSCNFLVFTILDSGSNIARRSVMPCPGAGSTMPLGVSPLTNGQTVALLAGLAAAGTDDPILAVFGYTIVRSTNIDANDLSTMATLAYQGISGTNGFVDYLTDNNVTTAQLAAYRKNIVSRLANPTEGYTKLIKDSVDATTTSAELDARGEAASGLLKVLVQAATSAGFSQDRVLEAFNAMGAIVVPAMQTAVTNGDLSAKAAEMVDSSVGGGIQKLKADKDIEKYSAALTTLGASGSDVTNYQSAAQTLLNAMISAFKTFDQTFDGNETQSEIQTAQSAFDTAMNAAFNAFMNATAASDTRINTMISNIDAALGLSTGLGISDFQFYKPDGTSVNWPLTMVIIVDWISSVVSGGGELTYTRDSTSIPSMMTWLGTCSDTNYFEKNSCEGAGGTWTAARTNFGPGGQDIPTSYASLFGTQEDIEILEVTRWQAQDAAGNDMSAHQTLEKALSDSLTALIGNIGGTTDGSTAINSTLKSAVVTLLKSPQF